METLNNNSEKVTALLNEILDIKIYKVQIGTENWDDIKLVTTNLEEAKEEFESIRYSDFDNQTDPTNFSMLEGASIDKEKVQELFDKYTSEIDTENIESNEDYESELMDVLENIRSEVSDNLYDFIDFDSDIETLDFNRFGSVNDTSDELLFYTQDSLGSDLENDNFHGYVIKYSKKGSGKYSDLFIENAEGEEIKIVKLRISDHTYNPDNNNLDNYEFISVEIANKNATVEKFRTRYSLRFNSDDDYSDVLDAVRDRLEEIVLDIE